MKLIKRLFLGAAIGALIAGLIFVGNKALPFITCTGQLIGGLASCDTSLCDDACDSAEKANNCEDAIPANYKMTTIFSLIICAGIGAVWGACGTISDVSDKRKRHLAQKENELKLHNISNTSIVKHDLQNYILKAQEAHKKEDNLSIYTANFEANKLKNVTEAALMNCKNEQEKLKQILNDQNLL